MLCVIAEIRADVSEDHIGITFRTEQPLLVCLTEKCEGIVTFIKRTECLISEHCVSRHSNCKVETQLLHYIV